MCQGVDKLTIFTCSKAVRIIVSSWESCQLRKRSSSSRSRSLSSSRFACACCSGFIYSTSGIVIPHPPSWGALCAGAKQRTVLSGSQIQLRENARMPLDPGGKIVYRAASGQGGIRYQADPPVCNICKQEITRKNFGWAYLEREGGTRTRSEFIACRGCTMLRAGGTPLLLFLERHHL